jgi:hypothetical protein
MLKFDSLNSNSSRPRTPPSSSSAKIRIQEASPPSRATPGKSGSPPYKSYINFLSNTNDDWKADEDEMMGYEDDDGDDFGLPSLSNTKRRTRRIATQTRAESSTLSPSTEGPSSNAFLTRRYSNSADIAIERPAPTYPMPKKSEGKILRPQYKEILKGSPIALQCASRIVLTMDNKTPPMLYISSTTLLYHPTPHLKKPMPSIHESHA